MNCFIFRSVDKFYHERAAHCRNASIQFGRFAPKPVLIIVVPHNAGWICENVMMHELNE